MKLHADVKFAIRTSVVGLGIVVLVCVLIGTSHSEWPGTETMWPILDQVAGTGTLQDAVSGESEDIHAVAPMVHVGHLSSFLALKSRKNDDPFNQR